jgi:hypothetical protein
MFSLWYASLLTFFSVLVGVLGPAWCVKQMFRMDSIQSSEREKEEVHCSLLSQCTYSERPIPSLIEEETLLPGWQQ